MRNIPGSPLVFIHIPKTGGMSMIQFLGLEHQSSDHDIPSPTDVRLGEGYIRFTVVRDPVARFRSAYRYSIRMAASHPDKLRSTIVSQGLGHDINDFVEWTARHPKQVLGHLHFARQCLWIAGAKPQIILHFERLQTEIQIIRPFLSKAQAVFPHLNASGSGPDINLELTERSEAILTELYRPDISLLYPTRRAA